MIAAPPQTRHVRLSLCRQAAAISMMTQKTRSRCSPLSTARRAPGLACGFVLALAIAGCVTREAPRDAAEPGAASEANLRSIGGSAIRGNISVIPRSNSVTIVVSMSGAAPGTYRVAIHANGNCGSPNGFSAGPPLVFAETGKPIVVDFDVSFEVGAALTRRVGGVALKNPADLNGRSVVVHFGRSGTLDAAPDVPNGRAACGVLGPLQPLKFSL